MPSSSGTDASKSSLRNVYLKLCEDMPRAFTERTDGSVLSMFQHFDLYKKTDLLLAYLPLHEEIDTLPFMRAALGAGKRVALPYFDPLNREMTFYEITSAENLPRGARGLAHPLEGEPLTEKDFLGSMCLVPGLVFDGEGNRVGYGAGYYDLFLAFYPGEKVGLVRSVQVSSNPLPCDEHDVPVDVLVTEGSIWHCRPLLARS